MKRLFILVFGLSLLITNSYAQTVVLKAKSYNGKTQYFVKREASWQGEEVWGKH